MPGVNPKILICCEPHSGLESIIPQLRSHNYTVTQAVSVYRAISAHSADPADVIIIDANDFSEKDYEVFDIFREALPGVKLFATISMSKRDKTPALLRSGVDGHFLEPFYADEIINALQRALQPVAQSDEDSLTQADKLAALGRFARGVAHEINNPLATISGWVQILVSEADEEDPHAGTFDVMQQELDRIAKVVQNLLAFSGQPSPQRQPVDLNEVIETVADEKYGNLQITTELNPNIPQAFANTDQLIEAFTSIIAFIQSQVRGKGKVTITTQPDRANAAIVTVRSSASVDQQVLRSMFDPFYSRNGEATEGGLGLAIAYGIIKGLGGSITAEQESKDLVFTLTVPAANEAVEQNS